MRCLYCGKKLSLLRKFADGQFCSDAHREAHQRLTDELAMARLGSARAGRTGTSTATRPPARGRGAASGLPPFAPLRPQEAVWIDFRRLIPVPVGLAGFSPSHFLPESGFRVTLRGMPAPDAAPWRPAVPPKACPALQVLHSAGPLLPDSASWVDTGPPPRPGEEPDPPFQPLVPLAAAPCVYTLDSAGQPQPLHRRKLVVIVPKSGLVVRSAGPPEAPPLRWVPPGQPAAWIESLICPAAFAVTSQSQDARLPSAPLDLDPPDWVKPAASPAEDSFVPDRSPDAPPLAAILLSQAGLQPINADRAARLAAAPILPSLTACFPEPYRPPAIAPANLPISPPARVDCLSAPAARPHCIDACALFGSTGPLPFSPPMHTSAGPALSPAWPGKPCLAPLAAPLAPAAPLQIPIAQAFLPPSAPGALPPVAVRAAFHRSLRLASRLLPAAARLAPAPPQAPARQPAFLAWPQIEAALPLLALPLQPPEPLFTPPDIPADAPDPSLSALGRAVAGPGPIDAEPRPAAAASHGAEPPADALPSLEPAVEPAPLAATAASAETSADAIPGLCRRLPVLPARPVDSPCAPAAIASSVRPCWSTLEEQRPAQPLLQLQLDHADGSGPRRQVRKRPVKTRAARPGGQNRFWVQAPSDLKWIAVALPLLLVVVVYSFSGNKPNSPAGKPDMTAAATATETPQSAQPWIRVNALQRIIMRRAGVRLFDDFRSGLGAWQGGEGWAKSWRYGDATFVQPGDLALLTSSISLSDYTLTFLGQIDRRSLNWVFRARDLDNYYSMRIVVTRGGPLPAAVLVRSVVIDGRERDVKTLPIPFPVQADTLYLVRMEVRGQDFTTYIQNQVVDHFSDPRLQSGGVGFFSPRGDKALLRWVEVSHQYDYLGRLCALLSPYGVQGLAAD